MLLQEVGAAFFLFVSNSIRVGCRLAHPLFDVGCCLSQLFVRRRLSPSVAFSLLFGVGCCHAQCPAAYDISIIENSVFNITTPSHLSLKVQTYQNNFFGYCTSNLQHFQQSLPAQDLDECKPSVA